MEQASLTKAAIEECAKNIIGMEAKCIEWGASAERSIELAVEEITKLVSALQSTPPEQRADHLGEVNELDAAHPEAVRMPPRPEKQHAYHPKIKDAGVPFYWAGDADAFIAALEAELLAERSAHERTRGELEQLQQSKLRMFVWDGRGKYKVVSCANSVSEARAFALEEMSLRGDLLNMREHIEHEQPLIYHRANAEIALTESGETEELNICLEAETKRRQAAEAELESLRAELAAEKGNHAD